MKKYTNNIVLTSFLCLTMMSCVDDEFIHALDDENKELFVLTLNTDEGGTYESEIDYGLELKFQDYFTPLPEATITISFALKEPAGMSIGEGDDQLHIKEVIYEIDDCTDGELDFTFNTDGTGTITLVPDIEIGMVEEFEVVFSLPHVLVIDEGEESLLEDDLQNEENRGFVFEVTQIDSTNPQIVFGPVTEFEYSVLDNETIRTEWLLDISNEEVFYELQEAFSPINKALSNLQIEQVEQIKFEFEYEEMKVIIELAELEEEADPCDPTDFANKEIEIEADFDAEDGEFELKGSYYVINDTDGEPEDELDFILKGIYTIDLQSETMTLIFQSLIDEDNINEEAYFNEDVAYTFTLKRD